MKPTFVFLAAATATLFSVGSAWAAPSFDPERSGLPLEWKYNPTRLETIPGTDAMTLSWYGQAGVGYFILHSEDLESWDAFPLVETGRNAVIQYGFQTNAPRFFVRLRAFSQLSVSPWGADSDGDGIPDWWELLYGFNPFDSSDATGQLDAYRRAVTNLGKDPSAANPLGLLIYTP